MKKLFIATAGLLLLIALNGCKKEDSTNDSIFGTVTDIDGNTYQTVKIGTQTWMMENLKVSRYNDGTAIPNVTDNQQWNALGTGAYCVYDNDESNNATYGKLYNWFSVNTGKLAPAGWHVPTRAEYNTLVQYLGNGNDVGGKMKSTSSLWDTPNTGADNNSHFSALPGGWRTGSGSGVTYRQLGQNSYFWLSDTAGIQDGGYYFNLGYSTADVYQGYLDKNNGYSIRCVKN